MTNLLPPLYDGHAPITLQQIFHDALFAFEEWEPGMPEPTVGFEGRIIPISTVFEAMRECTDLLPANILGAVTDKLTKPWVGEGPTDDMNFATAARVMGVLVRKRHQADNRDDTLSFPAEMNVKTAGQSVCP